jgi:hypothetical protein
MKKPKCLTQLFRGDSKLGRFLFVKNLSNLKWYSLQKMGVNFFHEIGLNCNY